MKNETSPLAPVHWFKSSHSGSEGGNCVEILLVDTIGVRDSKDLTQGRLAVSPRAWSAMTGALKQQ